MARASIFLPVASAIQYVPSTVGISRCHLPFPLVRLNILFNSSFGFHLGQSGVRGAIRAGVTPRLTALHTMAAMVQSVHKVLQRDERDFGFARLFHLSIIAYLRLEIKRTLMVAREG